jgi:Rod binding domain-containing protein
MAALAPIATHTAQTGAPSALNPRLVKAAHEFEAQMMKELLAPMTGKDPLFGDGEDSSDAGVALGSGSGSGGALADFASESLGQALSERGGFGIADRIIHQLGASAPAQTGANVTSRVTLSPRGNTVMRKPQ